MAINFHPSKTVEMASIFFFLLLIFPSLVLSLPFFTTIYPPSPGAEAFVFDRYGGGPYASISDGRVVKYAGPIFGFVEYGYCAPNRNKKQCDGNNNRALGVYCGRPLGMSYYHKTGEIYVADAFFGMCVIGPNGGRGTIIANSVDGRRFVLPDGITVDQETGDVYMTDASSVYGYPNLENVTTSGDATGILVKYNRKTRKVTTLMTNISGADSVEISSDGSYLVLSEHVRSRLLIYWLKGQKAHTAKVLLNLEGLPNKIVRTSYEDFWVAVNVPTTTTNRLIAQRFNGRGVILETVTVSPMFNAPAITQAYPKNGVFYLASLFADFVGVYWRGIREYVPVE